MPKSELNKPKLKFNFQRAPQFLISVLERTTVYIILILKLPFPIRPKVDEDLILNTFKGPIPIFFLISFEKGEKRAESTANVVESSGPPTNLKSISKEVVLEAISYPESFTLTLGTLEAEDYKEVEFELQIYASHDIDIKELDSTF